MKEDRDQHVLDYFTIQSVLAVCSKTLKKTARKSENIKYEDIRVISGMIAVELDRCKELLKRMQRIEEK